MPDFDHRELIAVAERLADSDDQACLRTAANRAYYAVYGYLRQRVVENGGTDCFEGTGQHGTLVNECRFRGRTRAVQAIANDLSSLLEAREDADYERSEEKHFTRTEVADLIEIAKELLDKINGFQHEDLRGIHDGMTGALNRRRAQRR